MRLLGIALSALLLAGCAVVPLAPVAYGPEPAIGVNFHYGSGYSRAGYRYHDRGYHRHDGR